jgi:hypothetical protein
MIVNQSRTEDTAVVTEHEKPDARSAADDYRQQRQTSTARKSGFQSIGRDKFFQLLAQNDDELREIAVSNGASESEIIDIIQEYKDHLATVDPGSELDDLNVQFILKRIVAEVEAACKKGDIPTFDGVAYGVSPNFALEASQLPVLETQASIIEVSLPFLPFCNFISKTIALTLPQEHHNGRWQVSNDPDEVRLRLRANPTIIKDWARVLTSYALEGWPPAGPMLTSSDLGTVGRRVLMLRAMEVFAIAHEYGHHVLRHGMAQSTSEEADHFGDEHDADLFAQLVSRDIGSRENPPNYYAMSGAGAVVMLGSLELLARVKAVLRTGSDTVPPRERHPPFQKRIEQIALLDQHAPESIRLNFQKLRASFIEILEAVWNEVKPIIEGLHQQGFRPMEDASDPSGWLPTSPSRIE